MSYYLRDRSDGQVEIVLHRTVQVGLYPNWSAAEESRTFLKDDQPELSDDSPACFARVNGNAEEAASFDPPDLLSEEPASVRKPARRRNRSLPAVVSRPRAPIQTVVATPPQLTGDLLQQALGRIQMGDSLRDIARDFGVSMFVLSAAWDRHKREMQVFMASAGQQPCAHCQRLFTPSISSPDTCARCSK